MSLVYEEFPQRGSGPTSPIHLWGEEKVMGAWGTHVSNLFYLEFMASKGTFEERTQARKELLICARKRAFWERHPSFNRESSERIMAKARKDWGR